MKVNNLLAAMSLFLCLPLTAWAQGNNTGMGGEDDDTPSIAERVLKLEKKTDAFNLYLNFAAAARATEHNSTWKGAFVNRQLRLEIKGHVTDKLFYRLRQHLNSGYEPQGEDNFAKATDMMMVGYTFNPKWEVQAGKIGQIWGGYEYDENPLFVYQYCDFVGHMECFVAGAQVTFKPIPTQEFGLQDGWSELCHRPRTTHVQQHPPHLYRQLERQLLQRPPANPMGMGTANAG